MKFSDKLALLAAPKIMRMERGNKLFTNRCYMFSEALDDALVGKSYVYSELEKTSATVVSDGAVIAITPATFSGSQCELLRKGFTLLYRDCPAIGFSFPGSRMAEKVSYYEKQCKSGEVIEISTPWVMLVGEQMPKESYYVPAWISTPARLVTGTPTGKFDYKDRLWHGIPSVEKTKGGRIFLAYESGNDGEPRLDNYVVYSYSDDGESFNEFCVAVHPSESDSRVFDANIWIDPLGALWLFWSQSCNAEDGYMGVWYVKIDNPDAPIQQILDGLSTATPKRICNGIKLNKPTVLQSGEWIFAALNPGCEELEYVMSSTDQGKTWSVKSTPTVVGCQHADEPMILQLEGDKLALFVRSTDGTGIRATYSSDCGRTWSKCQPSGYGGPCSRFHIRRLSSGRVMLINHHDFTGRNNLTVMLSEDNGKTFPYKMLLDGRRGVSYPDAKEIDGVITVTYDYDRNGAGEILLASFTEQDVINGGEIDKQKVRVVIKNTK